MAIVFEKQERSVPWFTLIISVVALGVLGATAYYLFFAPVPKIQSIIPPALQEANELSGLEFIDPSTILENPAFRRLRPHVTMPGAGAFGRSNPFVPF